MLESGGLTVGREIAEAHDLWAAALREAPRMHPPFDQAWFTGLLAARAAAPPAPAGDVLQAIPAAAPAAGAVERDQDWGEAPDVHGFVDRAEELATDVDGFRFLKDRFLPGETRGIYVREVLADDLQRALIHLQSQSGDVEDGE